MASGPFIAIPPTRPWLVCLEAVALVLLTFQGIGALSEAYPDDGLSCLAAFSFPKEIAIGSASERIFSGSNDEIKNLSTELSGETVQYGSAIRRTEVAKMNVLLIEAILDRYVARVQRRKKDWNPAEIEALLLKLREEILDCLR